MNRISSGRGSFLLNKTDSSADASGNWNTTLPDKRNFFTLVHGWPQRNSHVNAK